MDKQESTDITARRAENRKKFPAVTKIVDEFRAAFGEGVKVVWAQEGGNVVGKKPPGEMSA